MENQYLNLLQDILDNGVEKSDRTGTGTISVFGRQIRTDLAAGFPLLTTKKMFLRGIIYELLWFLSGDTNVKYLQDHKVRIWDEWATEEQCGRFGKEQGDLGPIYGHQWRNFGASKIPYKCTICSGSGHLAHRECWFCTNGVNPKAGKYRQNGVDQISRVVDLLNNNPNSRRIIVTGWNPNEADQVALPPCHTLFQFYVANNKLSCQLYQRSADVFLGVPFNIASYALLTIMFAQVCGFELGEFVHTFGDVHIYSNHIDQVKLQLSRKPYDPPTMELNPKKDDIFSFEYKDFKLKNYKYHPKIKAPIAV